MKWNLAQKMTFRFFFLYLVLFTFSLQFVLGSLLDPFWETLVVWLGNDIIGIEYYVRRNVNGSGDRLFDYLFLLLLVCISFIGMIIWSVIDRKRLHYQKLYDWLEVLIRYYVIYQMITYGLAKMFYLQMGPPNAHDLSKPLGEMSPMGLVWTFVGYSKGFTMLTGWLEFTGGILLMFRRTQSLGAMVVFAVMANVMAFNYFYDVPVKILSTHIVLMALFLMAPNVGRLWTLLVLNKATQPLEIRPLLVKKGWRIAKNWVKWIAISSVLFTWILRSFEFAALRESRVNPPGIVGMYEVDFYQEKGTDELGWQEKDWVDFTLEPDGSVLVNKLNRTWSYHHVEVDSDVSYALLSNQVNEQIDSLAFSHREKAFVYLRGTVMQDTVSMKIHKVTPESFPLMKRGFRWINETPFNR